MELRSLKELLDADRKQAEAMEPERQKQKQKCVQLSKTHDQLLNQVRKHAFSLQNDGLTAKWNAGSSE